MKSTLPDRSLLEYFDDNDDPSDLFDEFGSLISTKDGPVVVRCEYIPCQELMTEGLTLA